MPYDDPDPQDPMLLVGVSLPAGPEAAREMACVFAEELARVGLGTERILEVFRSPFYAGAHQAYVLIGEAGMRTIVEEAVGVWGRLHPVDHVAPAEAGPCEGEADRE